MFLSDIYFFMENFYQSRGFKYTLLGLPNNVCTLNRVHTDLPHHHNLLEMIDTKLIEYLLNYFKKGTWR